MSRAVPNINAAYVYHLESPVFSGGNVTQTARYAVGWVQPTNTGQNVFYAAPSASPFRQGSGTVTVDVPDTTGAMAIYQSIISAIATAEGLGTGDYVQLPDAKTIVNIP